MSEAPGIMTKPAAPVRAVATRWIVAIVLFIAVVSAFFDRISIAVLFNNSDFQQAMGTGFDPKRLGFLMTSFLFAYGFSGLVLSFVGDVFGPRRSLAAGAGLWGVFMALMGATGSYGAMIVFRVLLGLAEGPQFGIVNTVIKRWFPPREQARANSIWMVGSPLGSAIGFPLTIFLVATYGWRASFYVLAALNLLVVLPLVLAVVRDRPPGSAPVAAAAPRDQAGYLADVGLFIRDWRFWLIVIFNSAALIYLWGLNSWLPSYLAQVRHFNLNELGVFAALPFVLMFLGEIGAAALSDWLGRRAIICCVGLFLAGALMYAMSVIADPYVAACVMALSAGCWGASLPTLFALALEIIPARVTGSGVGVYNGIGNLVGACSPFAMGWLISETGSFDAGLMVLVLAGVLGSCAMIPLLRKY